MSTQLKKSMIAATAIISLNVTSMASEDIAKQLEVLKAQIAKLEMQLNLQKKSLETQLKQNNKKILTVEKKVVTTEKKVKKNYKKINEVKAHDASDNIKWDVDFRTAYDKISYKHKDGSKSGNDGLLSNRLWLNMKYAPSTNLAFYGRLSYNKAYGASSNNSQRSNASNQNANFDWISNESLTDDNSVNLKQAYFLYRNNSFFGNDEISWTGSIGRRPSTDGFLAHFREDNSRQSALAHTVNVEFDGASARFNLEDFTGVEGMWMKFCAGRGLSNAKPRFDNSGTDYATDATHHSNTDMAGLIFVPFDNGQYSIHTNYAKAWSMIGYADATDVGAGKTAGQFYDWGNMEFLTAAFVVDGIGDEINDFLDESKLFISLAGTKTHPQGNQRMLGSTKSQTGHSIWIGTQMPDPFSDDGKFGLEWNKGSKYWRPMTYAEDTIIGSKVAARGTAWEAYYHKPLMKGLSSSFRFTKISYDYTGSNAFFGSNGAPISMTNAPGNAVEEATDFRAYLRYQF